MTDSDSALSELQRDALTEVVNIGVSRAAVSLRKMVGEQVIMSVPALELISRTSAAKLIRERESDQLIAVSQDFAGPFSGRALLIFPASSSLSLVRAVAGSAVAGKRYRVDGRRGPGRDRPTSSSMAASPPWPIC